LLSEPGQPLLRDTAQAAEPLREGLDQTPAAELGPPEIRYPSLPIESARQLPVVIAQPETQRKYARVLVDCDAPGARTKAHKPCRGSTPGRAPDWKYCAFRASLSLIVPSDAIPYVRAACGGAKLIRI